MLISALKYDTHNTNTTYTMTHTMQSQCSAVTCMSLYITHLTHIPHTTYTIQYNLSAVQCSDLYVSVYDTPNTYTTYNIHYAISVQCSAVQ